MRRGHWEGIREVSFSQLAQTHTLQLKKKIKKRRCSHPCTVGLKAQPRFLACVFFFSRSDSLAPTHLQRGGRTHTQKSARRWPAAKDYAQSFFVCVCISCAKAFDWASIKKIFCVYHCKPYLVRTRSRHKKKKKTLSKYCTLFFNFIFYLICSETNNQSLGQRPQKTDYQYTLPTLTTVHHTCCSTHKNASCSSYRNNSTKLTKRKRSLYMRCMSGSNEWYMN